MATLDNDTNSNLVKLFTQFDTSVMKDDDFVSFVMKYFFERELNAVKELTDKVQCKECVQFMLENQQFFRDTHTDFFDKIVRYANNICKLPDLIVLTDEYSSLTNEVSPIDDNDQIIQALAKKHNDICKLILSMNPQKLVVKSKPFKCFNRIKRISEDSGKKGK